MTDFCGCLASYYTIDLLDFFYWIPGEDVGLWLWNSDPDEFITKCEVRDLELLLDFSGCLDAKL